MIPLAQFSHGKLKLSEDGSACNPPRFTHYKSSETKDARKRNRQYLVATTKDGMDYVGQNFGLNASRSDSLCKYMVGVVDTSTNKIKVYDSQLFHLQPWVFQKDNATEDVPHEPESVSYAEKSDMLTEAFGSAKRQRAMESRTRNKVESEVLEHSLKKAMEETSSQPNTPTKPQETLDILPTCNQDAVIPEEVYLMEHIISTSLMMSLKTACEFLTIATQQQINEWKTNDTYSQYILSQVQVLTGTGEKRKKKSSHMLFILYLIYMHNLKPAACRKGIPFINGTPDTVKTHLLQNFTVDAMSLDGKINLRNLSAKMRDKLALYIIVLALHAEHFRVNLSVLQKELHLSSAKMQTLARSLGCTVQKLTQTGNKSIGSSVQLIAQLVIPLSFPIPFRGKPKGRRR